MGLWSVWEECHCGMVWCTWVLGDDEAWTIIDVEVDVEVKESNYGKDGPVGYTGWWEEWWGSLQTWLSFNDILYLLTAADADASVVALVTSRQVLFVQIVLLSYKFLFVTCELVNVLSRDGKYGSALCGRTCSLRYFVTVLCEW